MSCYWLIDWSVCRMALRWQVLGNAAIEGYWIFDHGWWIDQSMHKVIWERFGGRTMCIKCMFTISRCIKILAVSMMRIQSALRTVDRSYQRNYMWHSDSKKKTNSPNNSVAQPSPHRRTQGLFQVTKGAAPFIDADRAQLLEALSSRRCGEAGPNSRDSKGVSSDSIWSTTNHSSTIDQPVINHWPTLNEAYNSGTEKPLTEETLRGSD